MTDKKNQHQEQQRTNYAAEFGWNQAFLNSHPELKQLVDQAVKGSWNQVRFTAALRDTNWFQNASSTKRQYVTNKSVDPASWQADYERMHAHIKQTYGQLMGDNVDPDQLKRWTEHAMMNGWTDEQVTDHIVSGINMRREYATANLGGTAAQVQNQIQQLMAAYGVNVSRDWQVKQFTNILNGDDTVDGAANYLKALAKSQYRGFADQLDAGKTMADIADPYIQSMASLLELNPNQLSINDRLVQDALTRTGMDRKGKQAPDPMSLAQFADTVRSDPRWMYTDQANEQFTSAAHGLLSSWGLI